MKQANGNTFHKDKQVSAFAQFKTKKKMAEVLGYNTAHLNEYWSFNWNDGMKDVGGDEEGLWVATKTGYITDYENFIKIA